MYRIEDRREAIKAVQLYLSVPQTGRWDSATRKSLRDFQALKGIPQSERVDYDMFEMLRLWHDEREMIMRAGSREISKFPYSLGDFGDDVAILNGYLSKALEDYSHDYVMPRGGVYSSASVAAVVRLREIFGLREAASVDEALYDRVLREIFASR